MKRTVVPRRSVLRPRASGFLCACSGRTIDVPSMFIGGTSDWGRYQSPGAFERLDGTTCTRMLGVHLVEAGHWVQQERPDEVNKILLGFLREVERP